MNKSGKKISGTRYLRIPARFGKSALVSGCSNAPKSSVLEDMVRFEISESKSRLAVIGKLCRSGHTF